MKKKISFILSLALFVSILIPLASVSAYMGGLADGKVMILTDGNPYHPAQDSTYLITDSDETTYYTIPVGKAISVNLGSKTNFNYIRILADSNQLAINTYANSHVAGKRVDALYSGAPDGSLKDLSISGIQYVQLKNNSNVDINLYEFDVFTTDPTVPEPQPQPEPEPQPQPDSNRAIMVITMTTGLEKEYDLSMQEVNSFIDWYEAKQAGSGRASYAIDKHDNNKGPFKSRKDYILFDRVLTFEVSEY
ncbi:hypothetical protein [Paenibacillus tundrae]|uniref:hypothetical protein n=1 Tax=Paenibacillus tundrae TaxID=528187 RepID=UPI0030D10CA1